MIKKLLVIATFVAFQTGNAFAGAWEDILKAADENNTDAVVHLIERGMDVNTSDRAGNTLLMIAARNGNEVLLDYLLRNRASAAKRNKYGDSAILLATMAGNLRIVEVLVSAGVSLSGPGWEPLHYAAIAGQAELAGYLIKAGAPIDAKAPNGRTPLMLAAQEGQAAIAKLLVEAGANRLLTDGDGLTALAIATAKGRQEVANLLQSN